MQNGSVIKIKYKIKRRQDRRQRESFKGKTTKEYFEGWMEFYQMKKDKDDSDKQTAWAMRDKTS